MNKNKQQSHSQSNAGPVGSLGLLNKALPLSVATPPQLRHCRHFQFNGMHFEANPLSLRYGDAGDAQRQDTTQFSFKPARDNISDIGAQPHGGGYNLEVHQPEELMPWQDHDYDNDKAGGEDNNNRSGPDERMHHVLTKYSRYPSDDEYTNNPNVNNNYNNSYIENENNNNNNQDQQEIRPIPTGFYSQPTKLAGCQRKATAVTQSKMDYITLAGFLLGYLMSNVLYFLCWYFSWLKGQVMKLRSHFLGQSNLWEFFDFDDTTRYSMKTKLILAPIILICSILYCVVNILHLTIKLVRSDVPRTVVDVVQRIAKNYWP